MASSTGWPPRRVDPASKLNISQSPLKRPPGLQLRSMRSFYTPGKFKKNPIWGRKNHFFDFLNSFCLKGFSCCWFWRPSWSFPWLLFYDTLGRDQLGELRKYSAFLCDFQYSCLLYILFCFSDSATLRLLETKVWRRQETSDNWCAISNGFWLKIFQYFRITSVSPIKGGIILVRVPSPL